MMPPKYPCPDCHGTKLNLHGFGGVWVDEIGDVILHRADLPPSRFVRFPLPLSSALVDG